MIYVNWWVLLLFGRFFVLSLNLNNVRFNLFVAGHLLVLWVIWALNSWFVLLWPFCLSMYCHKILVVQFCLYLSCFLPDNLVVLISGFIDWHWGWKVPLNYYVHSLSFLWLLLYFKTIEACSCLPFVIFITVSRILVNDQMYNLIMRHNLGV